MQKVREYMLTEHSQLERLWDFFLSQKDIASARIVFQKFVQRSSKHLEIEDVILFPLLNQSLGLEKGVDPIQVIDYEHKNMIKMLDRIYALLEGENLTQALSLGAHFKSALLKHQEKETERQYSLLNSFISISAKDWEAMLSGVYKNTSKINFFSKQKVSRLLGRLEKEAHMFLKRVRSQK
jgi:hemerythrin-like domain-containing protein